MRSDGIAVLEGTGVGPTTGHCESSGRLVVVSNRVGSPDDVAAGGLAVAMREALRDSRGMWFGWSGDLDDDAACAAPRHTCRGGIETATIDLTHEEHARYYLSFANGCLWPLLHYRLDLVRIDPCDARVYFDVNARFASALGKLLRPGDRVWVHDYHLLPLGAELRKSMPMAPFGFFLHVPFPPPEIFTAAPHHKRLGKALFAYDLIGFQTQGDCANFARYAVEHLGAKRLFDNVLSANGRLVRIGVFPIGIDAAQFARLATDASRRDILRRLRERAGAADLVVGVDRLDYSKGLPQRLLAFQRLLERDRGRIERASLIQVAPPTRESIGAYRDIRAEVEGLAGRINGRFGSLGWTPVQVLQQPVGRDLLAGLFRCSRVGLVTPLRDGMNLVAKEYVAAQDSDDPGVLVLSRFAGAAAQLRAALLVNPHDIDDVAETLGRALAMPLHERRERHEALRRNVATENISWWRQRFVAALDRTVIGRVAAVDVPVEAA